MATITFKGNEVHTVGDLPAVGSPAPDFSLVDGELGEATLVSFVGKTVILNIVPSLDTGICALSAKRFNQEAAGLGSTIIVNVSADLPFAQGRFCEAEKLEAISNLSVFRSPEFGTAYGTTMTDGPLRGLQSRAVVIINSEGTVIYTEQVPEIVQEPDYDAALAAMKAN